MIDDYYGHVIATLEGTAEESSVVWQRQRIGATTENTEGHRAGRIGGELGAGDGLAGQTAGYHRVGFYGMGARHDESSSQFRLCGSL